MRLHIEGKDSRKYVKWAKSKLAALTRLRLEIDLPKMVRAYVPLKGTLIYILSSEWGDLIRITSGAAFLRAWNPPTLANRSIQADLAATVIQFENAEPADWSRDFSTFARIVATQVVVKRDEEDFTITGSKATPNDPRHSFYQQSNAIFDHDGKAVITAPTLASASKLFQLTKWVDDHFETTDVPFPVDTTGVDFSSTPTVPFSNRQRYTNKTKTLDIPVGPLTGSGTSQEMLISWRLFAKRDATKIYLEVRMPIVSGILETYSTATAYVRKYAIDYLWQVWEYDTKLGGWTLTRELDDDTGPMYLLYLQGDFIINGDPFTDLAGTLLVFGNMSPKFNDPVLDSDDNLRVLTMDNRTLSLANFSTAVLADLTVDVSNFTVMAFSGDGSTTANILLDGTTWIENADVSDWENAQAISATELENYPTLNDHGIAVLGIGTERRGAITTDFVDKTYWVHTTGVWTSVIKEDLTLSRSGIWMYLDGVVYQDGDEIYNNPNAIFYWPSLETDGIVTATIPEAQTITVQGGTEVHGKTTITYDGPEDNGGFASGGIWLLGLGVLEFFTELDFENDLGQSSTFTVLGPTYQLTGLVSVFKAVQFVDEELQLVYSIPTIFTAEGATRMFPPESIIPDEFVV